MRTFVFTLPMLELNGQTQLFLTFGGLFLLGLVADLVGRHTPIPRVTLLLICGFAIGPMGLNWLPEGFDDFFPILTNIALTMVGFLLGQRLTIKNFSRLGGSVLSISSAVVLATIGLVFIGLLLVGVQTEIALLLAGIATATDPAATYDVVQENHAKGEFTDTLIGIVAIDDAWGLLAFSFILAGVHAIYHDGNDMHILLTALYEITTALVLGIALGVPLALLTGRIRPGQSTQAEAFGIVFLCAGLASWLEVSTILTSIVMGTVIANMIKHRCILFHVIEHIEWPFLILFFLLAGASLQLDSLSVVGIIGLAYMVFRIAGRVAGSYLGGLFGRPAPNVIPWVGLALTPQAGVAIGIALIAGQKFPEFNDIILPVVLGTTVIFEILGPIITRWVLFRVGDTQPINAHNKRGSKPTS